MSILSSRVAISPTDLALLRDEPELIAIADAILATQRPQLGRARRWRASRDALVTKQRSPTRLIVLAAAICVAIVVAGGALAGVLGLFKGTPAPPTVKRIFVSWNARSGWSPEGSYGSAAAYAAAKASLTHKYPSVDPSAARGVLAVHLGDGVFYLWAAPLNGGGQCAILQSTDAQGQHAGAIGGGGESWCIRSGKVSAPRVFDLSYRSLDSDLRVVSGAAPGAASVRVWLADGASVRLPVVEGFFLGPIEGAPRSRRTMVTRITSFDTRGARIGQTTLRANRPPPQR